MASSSPPPPPDPSRNNPFNKSSCSGRPSTALRRAKTLSNPEGETTWRRRDPLEDITNSYLSRESPPRLQRVPLSLPPRASDDLALTPSPSPSRIPREVPLRRTRSENPRLAPTSMHSSPPTLLIPLPSSPTRELRPRTRSSTTLETAAVTTTSSSPVPAVAGVRRTRSTANSQSGSGSTTPAPRRRTFGGLSAFPEESGGEDGGVSENEERRLRRRRSTTAGTSSSAKGGSGGRSGLR
ncbi:hypothetical protein JCM5353_007557 [Sporobolomyces roseus]